MSHPTEDSSSPTFQVQTSAQFNVGQFLQDFSEFRNSFGQKISSNQRATSNPMNLFDNFITMFTNACNGNVQFSTLPSKREISAKQQFEEPDLSHFPVQPVPQSSNASSEQKSTPASSSSQSHTHTHRGRAHKKMNKHLKKGKPLKSLLKCTRTVETSDLEIIQEGILELQKAKNDELVVAVKNLESKTTTLVTLYSKHKAEMVKFVKEIVEDLKKMKDLPKVLKKYAKALFIRKVETLDENGNKVESEDQDPKQEE
jgi:hypothetical protein